MDAIERAAREKQAAIIAREGDPDGIIASDAYLAELLSEQRRQAVCASIYCGSEITRVQDKIAADGLANGQE